MPDHIKEMETPEFFGVKPEPLKYQAPHNRVEVTGNMYVHHAEGK